MVDTFASFPSSRREGPSNVGTNQDRVTLPLVGDNLILPEDQTRASFLLRNESADSPMRYYYEGSTYAQGVSIRPGESVTIDNVKNEVFGRSEGPSPVVVSIQETRT